MATILVVDDAPDVRSLMRRLLEGLGYRVLVAESAVEAFAVSDGYDGVIDLLVMDVVLPEMIGPDVVQRIRARRPRVRALFVSGYGTLPVLQDMVGNGMDLIQKPFARGVFASRVREVLDAA